MKNTLSQFQKMQQKMALTAQMRLSVQLLAMAAQELNEYIDAALEKNPLLKKDEAEARKAENTSNTSGASAGFPEKPVASEENPLNSIISQIKIFELDELDMAIAEYLIYELDDNGYIKADIDEVAGDFGVDAERIEKVLSVIQSLEPAGIGARDTRECLQLQLKRLGRENSLEYTIVTDYLAELATNDPLKISKSLRIDINKAKEAIGNIKKLNPKPGSSLLSKQAAVVTPDLLARVEDKKVNLELNRDTIPRLRLSNPYGNKPDVLTDPDAQRFLKTNMGEARQLLENLRRREDTMLRVADYILKHQEDAIGDNISNIKCLTIKDLSLALNLHASTISRTLANKYIQINGKVLPLKGLLSHSVKKINGESVSRASVKNRIKEIIEGENKAKPLSDNTVCNMLAGEGIAINRRTVAKYRGSLRILPSYLRRNRGA